MPHDERDDSPNQTYRGGLSPWTAIPSHRLDVTPRRYFNHEIGLDSSGGEWLLSSLTSCHENRHSM